MKIPKCFKSRNELIDERIKELLNQTEFFSYDLDMAAQEKRHNEMMAVIHRYECINRAIERMFKLKNNA